VSGVCRRDLESSNVKCTLAANQKTKGVGNIGISNGCRVEGKLAWICNQFTDRARDSTAIQTRTSLLKPEKVFVSRSGLCFICGFGFASRSTTAQKRRRAMTMFHSDV
jgi:hypothetical protein